jgi:hypothetical protein
MYEPRYRQQTANTAMSATIVYAKLIKTIPP